MLESEEKLVKKKFEDCSKETVNWFENYRAEEVLSECKETKDLLLQRIY